MSDFLAGWSKCELRIPPGHPMAGYIARKGLSAGTLDPLFVRALVLRQGGLTVGIVVADILLIPTAWAERLRPRLARILATGRECVIIAATHTHSGPQLDSSPFSFSSEPVSASGMRALMHSLEGCMKAAAAKAAQSLQPVDVFFARIQVRGVATDRNHPDRAKTQPLFFLRFNGAKGGASLGVYGCHSTILGPRNLMFSGDLHGEISRLLEEKMDVALMAAGAAANISTRFTRRGQSAREMRRLAAEVACQVQTAHLRRFARHQLALRSRTARLRAANFQKRAPERSFQTGRTAGVAQEGLLIRERLSHAREFSSGIVTVPLTLLQIGTIRFAALPLEVYSDTGGFLWKRSRVIPLCYANGYWGYVPSHAASSGDYEMISSPFAGGTDAQLRRSLISFTRESRRLRSF